MNQLTFPGAAISLLTAPRAEPARTLRFSPTPGQGIVSATTPVFWRVARA